MALGGRGQCDGRLGGDVLQKQRIDRGEMRLLQVMMREKVGRSAGRAISERRQ